VKYSFRLNIIRFILISILLFIHGVFVHIKFSEKNDNISFSFFYDHFSSLSSALNYNLTNT